MQDIPRLVFGIGGVAVSQLRLGGLLAVRGQDVFQGLFRLRRIDLTADAGDTHGPQDRRAGAAAVTAEGQRHALRIHRQSLCRIRVGNGFVAKGYAEGVHLPVFDVEPIGQKFAVRDGGIQRLGVRLVRIVIGCGKIRPGIQVIRFENQHAVVFSLHPFGEAPLIRVCVRVKPEAVNQIVILLIPLRNCHGILVDILAVAGHIVQSNIRTDMIAPGADCQAFVGQCLIVFVAIRFLQTLNNLDSKRLCQVGCRRFGGQLFFSPD